MISLICKYSGIVVDVIWGKSGELHFIILQRNIISSNLHNTVKFIIKRLTKFYFFFGKLIFLPLVFKLNF